MFKQSEVLLLQIKILYFFKLKLKWNVKRMPLLKNRVHLGPVTLTLTVF